MVFGTKPMKAASIQPKDKRKISLLNSDFKTATGILAKRLKLVSTHTLSPNQFVAGSNRKIHHCVNLARDAIVAANKSNGTCGILDADFMAAFDYLDMNWVFMVLEKKGLSQNVINKVRNIYKDNKTTVVVNNVLGSSFPNLRWSLHQGDVPSMYWFAYGIDPLLDYLDKSLKGILICRLPEHGPALPDQLDRPSYIEQRYKVVGYTDDLKPAITSLHELHMVESAISLFEKSSGCRLHRDPASGKCKLLPLGKWRRTLNQEDMPFQFIRLSEHLDMLGVELFATPTQTKKSNGDRLQSVIKNIIGSWQAGRFMPLIQRPWSVNSYALSKLWYKCNCIDLRVQDCKGIHSKVLSWIYSDQLEKPESIILFRPIQSGGLGLHHVALKAKSMLIRSFLDTAINPDYINSLYHNALFRFYVLKETDFADPGSSPYYSEDFFKTIVAANENPQLNIINMSSKQWYEFLLGKEI